MALYEFIVKIRLCQTLVILDFQLVDMVLGNKREHSVYLDIPKTAAGVRGHVQLAVGGQDPVLANAPDEPVVPVFLAFEVDELHATPSSQQVTLRGLVAVTAMMVSAG